MFRNVAGVETVDPDGMFPHANQVCDGVKMRDNDHHYNPMCNIAQQRLNRVPENIEYKDVDGVAEPTDVRLT
jgi:hypothetical protein